jgi:hypothetical protein
LFAAVLLSFAAAIGFSQDSSGQQITPSGIHIGERLGYNITFQRYENVGYFETYAVSRGKLGDVDAIELRMKIKTTGILNAAFYQIDETRTTFAAPDTGNPLLVRRHDNTGVEVRESVSNYTNAPTSGFDLLTLIYRIRQLGGAGSFNLVEGEKSYPITLQPRNGEHLRTEAGEYDTTLSNVQGDYLQEYGIQNLRINLSTDDAHIPVMIRFRTSRGEVSVSLASDQIIEPEGDPSPTPTPVPTPKPTVTPKPKPTPTPIIENLPLSPDLGFQLGEALTYRVSNAGRVLADVVLQAKERKPFNREDSLLLSGTVASAEQGNGIFTVGDLVLSQVSPETLAPFEIVMKFSGPLARLNQDTRFDQKSGIVTAGPNRIDSPVGTHCILSLLYAIRSFNLTPSKDLKNPVNDTRVAVYWEGRTYIFMLRPSEADTITVNGQKVLAQLVTVNTSIPQFDQLGLKLWLSMEQDRVPMRIALGPYQAELITRTKNQPK